MNLRLVKKDKDADKMVPSKCCEMGTYEHSIRLPVGRKVVQVDYCISDIVAALNAAGIRTIASCCGHNEVPPTIILDNDIFITLMSRKEALEYEKKYTRSRSHENRI